MKYRGILLLVGLSVTAGVGVTTLVGLVGMKAGGTHGLIKAAEAQALYITRIVEGAGRGAPEQGLRLLSESRKGLRVPPIELFLVDEKGTLLAGTSGDPLPANWNRNGLPGKDQLTVAEMGGQSVGVTRLAGEPPRYLVFLHHTRQAAITSLLQIFQAFLFINIVLCVTGTVAIAVFYLRRKSKEAFAVLGRLEQGDLDARFQVGKLDEVGRLMDAFNSMADKIRGLVHHIGTIERDRAHLIQELSHDLRTPLTSVCTVVETLQSQSARLTAGDRQKVLGVATTELRSLRELVDDLFALGASANPGYEAKKEPIDFGELVAAEVEKRATVSVGGNAPIRWELKSEAEKTWVEGDRRLLRRLLTNVFENMRRHAETVVEVVLKDGVGECELRIRDDGPGFDEGQLARFGVRRAFQWDRSTPSVEANFGLGSVIIRSIVQLHGWSLEVSNWSEGARGGAELTFRFPPKGERMQKAA